MNRQLAAGFAFAALMIGVAGLAGGLAMLFASPMTSLSDMGLGFGLILVGLGSWAAGIRAVKRANRPGDGPGA
jgi:hypothetical protein